MHKAVPAESSEDTHSGQANKRAKVTNAAAAVFNRNNRTSRDGSAESSTPPGTPVRNGRQQQQQQQQQQHVPQQPRRRYLPEPQDDAALLEERRNSHAGASASNSSQGTARRRSSEDGCHSAHSDDAPWPFVVPNKGLRSSRTRAAAPLQPLILAGIDIPDGGGDDEDGADSDGDVRMPDVTVSASAVQQAAAALRQARPPSPWRPVLQEPPVQQQLAQLMDLLAASHPAMPQLLQPVAPQQMSLQQQMPTQQLHASTPSEQHFCGVGASAAPQLHPVLADPAAQLALDAAAAVVAQAVHVNTAAEKAAAPCRELHVVPPAADGNSESPGTSPRAAAAARVQPVDMAASAEAIQVLKAAAGPMDIAIGMDTQRQLQHAALTAEEAPQSGAMACSGPFSSAAANTVLPAQQQQLQQPEQHSQQPKQQPPKSSPIILETSQDSALTCHRGDSPPHGPAVACTAACHGAAAHSEAMQPMALLSWPSGDSNMSSEGDSELHDGSHGDVAHTHAECFHSEQHIRDDGKLPVRLDVSSGGRGDGSGCQVTLTLGSASGSPSSPLTNDVF